MSSQESLPMRPRHVGTALLSLALRAGAVLLAPTLLGAPAAQTQEARVNFSVPAQPLASGLLQLGEQARVSIAVPQELIAGKLGAPVEGEMSVRAALTRILAKTGLSFEFVGPDAVRIIAAPSPRPH